MTVRANNREHAVTACVLVTFFASTLECKLLVPIAGRVTLAVIT